MKTFLVTGCSRGIGLATSRCLKESGYQVVGIARKRSDIEFPGILYCADLTNSDETMAVFNKIKSEHSIDGIINNIGDVQPALIENTTMDSFFEVMYSIAFFLDERASFITGQTLFVAIVAVSQACYW